MFPAGAPPVSFAGMPDLFRSDGSSPSEERIVTAATDELSPARRRLRQLMGSENGTSESRSAVDTAETAETTENRETPGAGDRARRWLPRTPREVLLDPGRAGCLGVVLAAVIGCAVLLVGRDSEGGTTAVPSTRIPAPGPAAVTDAAATSSSEAELVVSVVGRVHEPGLVTLAAGSRVADALRAAGGPLPETDTLALNLARELSDGEQLYVGVPVPSRASKPAPDGSTAADESSKVDLNRADEQRLRELPGIGPVTAGAILRWRSENGGFESVSQLREVDGIGTVRFSRLRDLVRV
ncbi:competence protein ComEA [Actinopolyspora lacussalsi subsp. righensis]|uniref:Competence protein ComEA n=2 Tax=Actinopolyspora righensis TaxID=995060 RepID=A0A1I6YSI4_9ACTN|nr:competence protein ComEA [Actinopolyspora righensis]